MADKTGIYLHGFDARSSLAINEYFANQKESEYFVAAIEKSASIFMVDVDNEVGQLFMRTKRVESPSQPLVVISSSMFSSSDPLIFVLKKPLVYKQLLALLRQMVLITPKNAPKEEKLNNLLVSHFQNRINDSNQQITGRASSNKTHSKTNQIRIDQSKIATLVGRQADIDISNPQEIMKVVYDPEKTILNSIKKAMERSSFEKKLLQLTNFDKIFVIDPMSKTLFTFVNESVLRPLCLLELREKNNIKKLKKGRMDKRFKQLVENSELEVKEWQWDEFLWKMALWTSRGKLPKHIELKKPVYLSEWPNLTRLQIFPYAAEIAAVMSHQVVTLTDIAEQLGIEQRFVFAFFSAAYALGIADMSNRQSDQLFEQKTKPYDPKLNSSVKSIINRLNKKTDIHKNPIKEISRKLKGSV